MVTFISLGINADLSKYGKAVTFDLKTPIKLGTRSYESLNINNYAGDAHYSPEGKSAVTIMLDGDTYNFWKKAKEKGTYKEEKLNIAKAVIEALAEQFPETAGKVEVQDVATPLTYERYCGTWKGSWMTEMTGKTKIMNGYPAKIKGIEGVYFAGQRMTPPGGLPIALMTGRTAVQHLCRDTKTLFVSEE
jgi:phytoene dehydrogenase-like protein